MLNKEKKHLKVLLSSIKKIYNKAIINGKLEIKELYYLNVIFNLINKIELTFNQTQILESYYNKLSHYSDNICKPDIIKTYYTPKKKFVQATKEHCDNVPLPDYNIKDCVYITTVTGANYLNIGEGSTLLNMSYILCNDNTNTVVTDTIVNDGYLLNDFETYPEICIKPNSLKLNNILISNLDEEITIDFWKVRFEHSSCVSLG